MIDKEKTVENIKALGLGVAKFCRQNSISADLMYYVLRGNREDHEIAGKLRGLGILAEKEKE